MPNLCETRMRVSGPAQLLDAFVEDCLPAGDLDFEKIIPMPAAVEETQARDWRIAHWGTSYIVGFELVERTRTMLEATFATPWSTADKVFREMARRHPHVAIRIAVAEPENEYSYLFTAAEGVVREEEPGLTEEFMEEVQGAPTEVDDFYLRPATLRPRPVLHFRRWRDESRLRQALAAYSVYEPPIRASRCWWARAKRGRTSTTSCPAARSGSGACADSWRRSGLLLRAPTMPKLHWMPGSPSMPRSCTSARAAHHI